MRKVQFKISTYGKHLFGGNVIHVCFCISSPLHNGPQTANIRRSIKISKSLIPINVVKLQVNWPPIVVICQSVVPSRTSSGGDSSWPSLTWHGVVSLANVSQSSDQIPFVIFVPLEMLGYLRSYYIDYDCPSVRLSVLQSFCMSVRPDIYSIIREWNNHTERILLINVNLVKRM